MAHASGFGNGVLVPAANGFLVGGDISATASATEAFGVTIDPASTGGVLANLDATGKPRCSRATTLPVRALATTVGDQAFVGYGNGELADAAHSGQLDLVNVKDGSVVARLVNALQVKNLTVTLPNRVIAGGYVAVEMDVGGKTLTGNAPGYFEFIVH